MKMYKKANAGNQIMIIPFILLLLIIGVGIWIGISIFFSSSYDFRKIDATELHNRIYSCLSENDLNWESSSSELEKEFYETCKINKEVVKANLGLEIAVDDKPKIKWVGDPTQCGLSKLNKNFPRCENSTLIKTIGDKQMKIRIIAGSSQQSKNLIAGNQKALDTGEKF